MAEQDQNQRDWAALAREVLTTEIEGLEAVRDHIDGGFTEALRILAQCTGRVVVTGLGKSGLVARKIAATFSSTGTPSYYLHPVEGAHGDMGMLRPEDVILAVSNSGETDELNALLPSLRSLCNAMVALTGRDDSTMARMADAVVNSAVPREACSLNLAPTASTTAALALGDALAVCLMNWKSFQEKDFLKYHPGGSLGRRLSLCVSTLMHTENLPVAPDTTTLGQALNILNQGGLGTVALVDSTDTLTGILTDGDVRRLVIAGSIDPVTPVSQSMTRSPRSALPTQSVAELLDIMEHKAITVLPITDESGRLLGLVHLHDLLGKGRLKFAG